MKVRLVIWAAACLAISIIFFGELWLKLPKWLSPQGLQSYGVFHWAVLCLCVLWLWLKRKDIVPWMRTASLSLSFILAGAALLAMSVFLPRRDELLIFLMLLGWLGSFTIIFSRASLVPGILLAIYGFTVAFPLLRTGWLGEPAAVAAASTATAILKVFGLPITSQGLTLHCTSVTGDAISTTITPGCAGWETIGVFIALFSLMMLDVRLPLKKAWYVFLIGFVGTWLQNILRIIISVAAGYYWGMEALNSLHYNLAYFIFPLWYALFAYIYLRQARGKSIISEK
jgi:exosortase/archaeosortase family protein